jgi:thiol-disulfide isomerase/thioredoxin
VTIVEFWTFACGNCLANLPAYANWQKQFADKDVLVIGVHTPETESERVKAGWNNFRAMVTGYEVVSVEEAAPQEATQ